MDAKQLVRMNTGEGKHSYASNSLPQASLIKRTKPYIDEAMLRVLAITKPRELNIADLGCGSGPNALLAVDLIFDAVRESGRQRGTPCPELHAYLNDLPENDFNTIFKAIPSFYQRIRSGNYEHNSCFIYATPGSFYGRLFPHESIHFVYSACALHWLSQVPSGISDEKDHLDKGNIDFERTSSLTVIEAYQAQFRKDFTNFLKLRSEEIVLGGCMVLLFKGRNSLDHSSDDRDPLWSTFANVLEAMIKEGRVEEENVNSFNMPIYEAYIDELRDIIKEEGSFDIIQLETIPYYVDDFRKENWTPDLMTNYIRAITEYTFAAHFGEEKMDELFDKFKARVPMDTPNCKIVALVVSIARKI